MAKLPDGYELREVGLEHLDEIGQLRARVWLDLGALLPEDLDDKSRMVDEWEEKSRHWAIFRDSKIVASARLTVGKNPVDVPFGLLAIEKGCSLIYPLGVISRLVVAPEERGKGLATCLDSLRIEVARAMGAKAILGVTRTRHETLARKGFQELFDLSEEEAKKSVGFGGGGQTG